MLLPIRLLSVAALILATMLSAFSQKPEMYIQTGHSGSVSSVAFSPDGKTVASGSVDNTLKLWDVATGQELRTLKGHSNIISSIAFSPDGKTLGSVSNDQTIKLWDPTTGQVLRTLQGHGGLQSIAFSSDGKTLASGSFDNTIKLWDIASGQELRALKGHPSQVLSIAFSPDGRILASGSSDKTIKLWDVASGRELRTLVGHLGGVFSVAFRPDGKVLASGSWDDKTIRLWDVNSGQEQRTIVNTGRVRSIAFSADGTTLANNTEDTTIKLWRVASGQELRTLKGHQGGVFSVAFSPDGTMLASGSADKTIKLWDVASGQELLTLGSHSGGITSIAFSSDQKTLASGNLDKTIRLWDVASSQELRTLKGHSAGVYSIAFNPDGKTLASGSLDKTIKLWDVASGHELRTLKGHAGGVFSVAFSPDGKILASGSADSTGKAVFSSTDGQLQTIKLWDVESGQELRTFGGHSNFSSALAFSTDGKMIANGGVDQMRPGCCGSIKVWDVATGQELKTFKGHSDHITSIAFSPDGKTLASGSLDGTITIWDAVTRQELRLLKGHSWVESVAFSPDGKTLASGGRDFNISLWDVPSGVEFRTLRGHSGNVSSVAFNPNGQTLATGSRDGKVNLWDVLSGNNLVGLVALDENDWVVVTPDGLFDGTPNAWKQINWRFSENLNDLAPAEVFFNEFYYPGLLSDIFANRHPTAPSDISKKDRRQPHLKLALSVPQTGQALTVRQVVVKIDISQAPAGAQDGRLFRNGSLVKVWRGDVLKGKGGATLETTIPIVAGENRLTAYAFNRDNIKSTDATLTVTGADSLKRKGVGYVLNVGVNEYANTQYSLKYAVADARDFAEELKHQQSRLNNYERVEVIALNDKDATKANILKALADLSAKVQPEDALVIFFAGHGTAQQNRFYLIPHDLGYAGSRTGLDNGALQNILSHSISDEEILRVVEGIDAGQMLLVIDACNSGQALEAEEKRRGPMNSKGLAQLAYEKGMYILTAAQSYQAANEAARLGHGYLTYALVEEGLKTNAADKEPKDGQVLLREWLDFATERVPQMQQDELDEQKKQGRQLDRIKFAEAGSGNEGSIQRPRVFYRRETETHPLVVARP